MTMTNMTIGYTEILSFVIVAQLVLFIFFLASSRSNRKLSNLILAIFLFAQLIVVLNRACAHFGPFFREHFLYIFHSKIPFSFLWAPTLFLYARSLIYNDFKLSKRDIIHAVPFQITLSYICAFYMFQSTPKKLEILDSGGFCLPRLFSTFWGTFDMS